MDNATDTIVNMLTLVARYLLLQKAQAKGEKIELEKIKVFKYIQKDVDEDGQDEVCFAAGIPGSIYAYEVGAWLIDTVKNGDATKSITVELALPDAAGFRDLQVIDVNNDHILEILSLWQIGSGAFLSLYIYQWDGKVRTSLFPEEKSFSQGFIELKDVDADGVDEIVIWEQIWGGGANWGPKRFSVYAFRYNGHSYELGETYKSERYYYPGSIVSRDISLFGLPVYPYVRSTPVEEYRRRYNNLVQTGQMNEQFFYEIARQQKVLCDEKFYRESVEAADLVIEALVHLSDPIKRAEAAVYVWSLKGVAFSGLGNYSQAISCYLQALSAWVDDLYASQAVYYRPGLRREMAFMYARIDDFEHALTALSDAQTELAALGSTDPKNREELAKLHSAFGIIYSWLGDASLAVPHFEEAIAIDSELKRSSALAINYTQLGNAQRSLERYHEAIQAYQSALQVLDEVSERDREADVYLEMGLTLVLTAQYEEGVKYLHKSLLLTSIGNLYTHAAVHYLYLGDGHKEMGDMVQAERFFSKAQQFAEKFGIPETKWQALYRLAFIYEREERWQDAQRVLADAIETIEQLRSQYLPEALKISFFANEKTKAYEAIVQLYYSLGQMSSPAGVSPIENAFDYVERAKSRVFIEELSTTSTRNFEGLPDALIEQEVALVNELRNLQLRYRAAASEQRYEWGNDITQLESRLEQLWSELYSTGSKGMEYVELRRATPLNFTDVKSVLKQR